MRLILVTGPTGVGKTTYSISIAKEVGAVRFSIDPWMQTLFAKDMESIDFSWMMERVERCYTQIWEVCEQILSMDGNVVLDLGFTTKAQRTRFTELAAQCGGTAEIHYLEAPVEIRKARVKKRNSEKDPAVYAFDVDDSMFEFMEPRFEIPDAAELSRGKKITSSTAA